MRKSKFTEEQIIGFLKQAEAGLAVAEICRKGGFSDATFYKWRAKFGGMEASDARRLRELEGENAKLKHLLPHASVLTEHPLELSVTIAGSLAGGIVECPTHRFSLHAVDGGLQLDLASEAWLDRDVVILVKPREPLPSLVIQARDTVPEAAPIVVMAVFQPPPTAPRKHIALKLLVDCSGSMGGDSIASARLALHGVLAGLTEHDQVSVSRFGSTVEHVLAPSACTPRTLRQLKSMVNVIDANLGSTEMEAALKAVFGLPVSRDCQFADVLLVTDGEIWQAQETITAARDSGHRVFAIGVGSSPAEGVLRGLAEATGGACEFATPGEALEAAASRMLLRIRHEPWRNARVDWGFEPLWQTELPSSVFGGDTVIAFAGMSVATTAPTVRLLATDAQRAQTQVARGEAESPCPGDTLPRMAAARRIATADDNGTLELAVAYQLMSKHTNCILVHQRADVDKPTEAAELHRVSSMLAAGWGATSTVVESASMNFCGLSTPSVWRSARAVGPWTPFLMDSIDDTEIPTFLRKHDVGHEPVSLNSIALTVIEHLGQGGTVQGLASHCENFSLHPEVRAALEQAVHLGVSDGIAWLLLAHLGKSTNQREPSRPADRHATTASRWARWARAPRVPEAVRSHAGVLCIGWMETLANATPSSSADSGIAMIGAIVRRQGVGCLMPVSTCPR